MANIFISYNREDEDRTRALVNDIQELGHTAWFDHDLSGGQAWWDTILEAIRNCDVFVFVLTDGSLNSSACKLEYTYASELGKTILPVLIGEEVSTNLLPPILSKIQFVDYRKQDRNAVLHLAKAITALPPFQPLPDPLPLPPEVPLSYLGSLSKQLDSTSDLSYEEQSALLLDFKRGLQDPESAKDARTLLEKLRKRRDLLASISVEIDELLGNTMQTTMEISHAPKTEYTTLKQSQKQETPLVQAESKHLEWQERLTGALFGAILSTAIGAIVLLILYPDGIEFEPLSAMSAISGVGGMIAGVLSGKRRLVIVSALIGAIAGGVACVIIEPIHGGNIVVFGLPLGAIFGAIIGLFLENRK